MKLFFAVIVSIFLSSSYAQTLHIGTTPDNPPFSSLAGQHNDFYGFEIDLMMEICNRINAQCQFQPITIRDVINLVNSEKIDFVIANIISPSLDSPGTENFVFSIPYLLSTGQFLVDVNSDIKTIEDVRYQNVGVRLGPQWRGPLFRDFLLQMYNNQLTVTPYVTMADLLTAFQNKDIAAVFTITQTIQYWYVNNKELFRLIGEPLQVGNGFSIMGNKSHAILMNQINQALYAMEQDGTYLQIYNRYFTLGS